MFQIEVLKSKIHRVSMRLTHLGKTSYWIWDDTTPGIGVGDLLICANGRADIDIVNIVVEKAKAAGATIAMVTAAQEGYLYDFADVITRVPAEAFLAKGDFVKSKQLMGNLFEQSLFLLYDMLAMQLQQEMGVTPEGTGGSTLRYRLLHCGWPARFQPPAVSPTRYGRIR